MGECQFCEQLFSTKISLHTHYAICKPLKNLLKTQPYAVRSEIVKTRNKQCKTMENCKAKQKLRKKITWKLLNAIYVAPV